MKGAPPEPRREGLVRHKTVTDSNCTKGHVCQYALIVMDVCIRFQEVLSATFKEKKKDCGRIFKVVKREIPFLDVLPLFAPFRPWLHRQ